jgi:hypothetical protein
MVLIALGMLFLLDQLDIFNGRLLEFLLAGAADRPGRLVDRSPYRRFPRRFQMSRYIMIRRLARPRISSPHRRAGPAGPGAHSSAWGKSWPLFLILAGVLMLAERAALAAEGGYPPMPYPALRIP